MLFSELDFSFSDINNSLKLVLVNSILGKTL